MGGAGIFRGQRQPLGQISTNAKGSESVKKSAKVGSHKAPVYGKETSVLPNSTSDAGTTTESTAPSSVGKSEDSLRGWLAAKARPIRSSIFPSSVHHRDRYERAIVTKQVHPAADTVVHKHKEPAPSSHQSSAPVIQRLSVGLNDRMIIIPVDPSWSLSSVLSQVCGGPLERVRRSETSLELCFLHSACAQRFYYYAHRGQFIIRGRTIEVSTPTDVTRFSAYHQDLMNEPEYQEAILNGARRTISIHKRVEGQDQRLTPSRVSIPELRAIFESVGTVLQIRPMFARKSVAFVIHYEDVLSAIRAKNAFDHRLAPFSALNSWKTDYVKDCTERPCVFA